MNSQKALVSIIIPTYNNADLIEVAVQSALNQTYRNIEVIVIDDGSKDNTQEILKKYKDIIVIQQENQGVAAARNAGIKNAKGKYIAILDADDKWMENRLELMIPLLEESNYDLLISNYFYVDEMRRILSQTPAISEEFEPPEAEYQYSKLLWEATSFAMMVAKLETIKSVGGYDETLRGEAEDYDLWLRLLRDGATYNYIGEPLVEYMIRSGSLSKSYSKKRKQALKKIFFKHKDRIGYLKAFILYRYHLCGYRLDMLIVSIREHMYKRALYHFTLLFFSPVMTPIVFLKLSSKYISKKRI